MVSIIIPVYKVEQYLRACLDSVLAQTYGDLQVILVDDGSPDSCGAICDEYARKDSRVLALHKENGGVSSARNYALPHVTGEFLTFCDSDDLYGPDWIETLVTAARQQDADIVVGNYRKIFEDGSPEEPVRHAPAGFRAGTFAEKADYCFNKLFTPDQGWEIWARLFRAEIIRRENIRFCETCGNFAEDLGFSLLCTLFARRVISVEMPGYGYRIRGGSMMQRSINNPKLDCLLAVCRFCRPVIRRALPTAQAEQFGDDMEFFLLGNQFSSCMWASQLPPEEIRSYVISMVKDWPALEAVIRERLKRRMPVTFVPRSRRMEIRAHLRFLLGGSWLGLRLQCKLIRTFRPLLDGTTANQK